MSNFDSKQIGVVLIIIVGIVLAFLSGNSIAEEDLSIPLGAVFLIIVGAIYFSLGSKIYFLMPASVYLLGRLSFLPVPFSFFQLTIVASTIYYIFNIIFKRSDKKTPNTMLDIWIWLNIFYLFTVFLRNPIGFAFLQIGDRVGGLPYVNTLLALFSYIILRNLILPAKYSNLIPVFILATVIFSSIAQAIGALYPDIGISLSKLYSDFAPISFKELELTAGDTRLTFLSQLGVISGLFLISKYNPLSFINLTNLGKALSLAFSFVMIFLSGFRSGFIMLTLYTLLSAFLRERLLGSIKIAFGVLLISVAVVLISFTNFNLPMTAQRALCFLPGNWDPIALEDAKDSSEWRYEMWEIALTSHKYIRNKIFGDGFGFARSDFERARDLESGITTLRADEQRQEIFLLDGDFHSGPISAIRVVGYFGLVIFLILFYFAVLEGLSLINQSLNTPYEFYSYFIGIPFVLFPVEYLFIFGDYKSALPAIIFNSGILKMLKRSISYHNKSIG